jgi:hypothetical protein
MELMGGSLVGTGTIAASVQNLDSTVAAGSTPGSTGILRIAGDYTHPGSGSVLEVDLKGTNPGRQFDQLQVTGKRWSTGDRSTSMPPARSRQVRPRS